MKRKKKERKDLGFVRSRSFIGLACIAASLLLFAAGSFLPRLLNSQTTVVVMTADVAKGQMISPADLAEETVFTSSVKAMSPLKSAEAAAGKYACADLFAGDVVTAAKVSPSPTYNDPLLYELAEGRLAISIGIDSLEAGLADKLIPGDVVTVYALPESTYAAYGTLPADAAVLYPQLLYVKVIAVTDAGGSDTDNAYRDEEDGKAQKTRSTAAVTLEVNAQQAALLAGIQSGGRFHLALAARGERAAGLLKLQEDFFNAPELPALSESTEETPDA